MCAVSICIFVVMHLPCLAQHVTVWMGRIPLTLSPSHSLTHSLSCCCAYKILKKSRMHHTQLKYIHRVEFCKDELEKLDLDELNNERFGRSAYRSRVLAKHKTSKKFDSAMFESIGSKFHQSLSSAHSKKPGDNDKDAKNDEKDVDEEAGEAGAKEEEAKE